MERASMYKIMIIEDDLTIAKAISEHLSQWGCDTACVTEFHNVAEQVLRAEPQLVLLDIALRFPDRAAPHGERRPGRLARRDDAAAVGE